MSQGTLANAWQLPGLANSGSHAARRQCVTLFLARAILAVLVFMWNISSYVYDGLIVRYDVVCCKCSLIAVRHLHIFDSCRTHTSSKKFVWFIWCDDSRLCLRLLV